MNPGERVYLICEDTKHGTVRAKRWHDFECEYDIEWDNGERDWQTALTIRRIPKSHRKR